MSNETVLGLGLATGMAFHAPAGTKLPAYPSAQLDSAWKKIGDVSEDGITQGMNNSTSEIKNWANKIKRVVLTDHSETIQVPLMDTTEETLKTVFRKECVQVTAASAQHGKLIDVQISDGNLPEPEAYLFLMKDGDTMVLVGTEKGQIRSVENVAYKPGQAIVWTPTITGLDDGWHIVVDDGAVAKNG